MISPYTQLLADYTTSFWFPESASSFSAEVDSTFMVVLWICVLFFIPITICLFYFAIRYMKPKGTPAESSVTHNTKLEVAWSVLPCFLLVYIFIKGSIGYIDQRRAPEGSTVVSVKSQKWSWLMDYGSGVFHPELHLVVDRPTQLVMRSSDVIHSLFVPAFRAKKDIVPGRYNEMWFLPRVVSEKVKDEELQAALEDTKTNFGGIFDPERYQFTSEGYKYFDLYCTEYCGKDHSMMQSAVVVHSSREDFDEWIKRNSGRRGETPEQYGALLFSRRGCGSCHSIDGSKLVGPSFQGSYGTDHVMTSGDSVKVDENYIRESILEPKAKVVAGYAPVMPSFKGQLSDDDIDSLIAYIKSLNPSAAATANTVPAPAN